ncbi:MAG: ATP-binding protein [Eggerthellaceae bacterium]|nr:ATP-binding protein [Eggerthellaceae bacterium]
MDGSLTSFIDEVCGDSRLRVEDDLGGGFVRLKSSEAQLRQAKQDIRCTEDIAVELLRNAFDAEARNIFVALAREGSRRSICVIDDGKGIPKDMQSMVFEPRVTSKLDSMYTDRWGVHGRGMALYSISVNATKAQVCASDTGQGTSIAIESDVDGLPEKTDQSSLPLVAYGSEGAPRLTGPHNINRAIAEFALEYEGRCNVYLGSPAEIVATLYEFGNATLSKAMRAFSADPEGFAVAKRLCLAGDPASLAHMASDIGLNISERTARRAMDGEIPALDPFIESLKREKEGLGAPRGGRKKKGKARQAALGKDARGLRIQADDLKEFSEQVRAAYMGLAQRYYLEEAVVPDINVSKDGIHIRIPISKLY